MSAVTLAIRIMPLTLIRRQVQSRFLKSFLYYVPYVTLAVMTFPAILHATQTPISGGLALVAGLMLAWCGASLFKVSAACCIVVFIAELFFQ
jgi:branched-subunit amino acid transport protein